MSSNNWEEIRYDAVPSYAMKNYRRAFSTHDTLRFNKYIEDLKSGKVKINSSTLYPYDLVEQYTKDIYDLTERELKEDTIIEEQWKALPNYISEDSNVLVMADVSGSMLGRPMDTSIGLAIYFAQRNKGEYHNKFMTFSSKPIYITINDGDSLATSITKVARSPWGFNTDLNKAMKTILEDAIRNNISPDQMPKALLVITDMEIDPYNSRGDFYNYLRDNFAAYGYKIPKIIFWNVQSRKDTYLTKNPDVILVSGQSPAVFKSIINSLDKTSEEVMLETLNDPIYDCITI
jgi:hypothetical protein